MAKSPTLCWLCVTTQTRIKIICGFIFVMMSCTVQWVVAQSQLDSLHALRDAYQKKPNFATDTNYINLLNQLAFQYYTVQPDSTIQLGWYSQRLAQQAHYEKGQVEALRNTGIGYAAKSNYDEALRYYFQALPIAEKSNYLKGVGRLYNNIANVYTNQSKYEEALQSHFKALKMRQKIGDKQGEAASLGNIAIIYNNQGKYNEALENHLKSLKIKEEIKDQQGISISLNNIAIIYNNLGRYEEALRTHLKSLSIKEQIGDKQGEAASLSNIATIYMQQHNYKDALAYHQKSLQIKEEIGDKQGIAVSLNNIGNLYEAQGKFLEALSQHQQSLAIGQAIGDLQSTTEAWRDIGECYLALHQYNKALVPTQKALATAQQIGNKEGIRNAHEVLSKVYQSQKKYELALLHYEKFKLYADSLNNNEGMKKTAQLTAQYEFDKKEMLLRTQQAEEKAANEEKLAEQRIFTLALIGALLSVVIIALFILLNRQKIIKAKNIIEQQKVELELANEEIETQAEELAQSNSMLNETLHLVHVKKDELALHNRQIMASVNYAKRIQTAMLPLDNHLESAIGKENFFVLYQPRDIVSGDFYFLEVLPTTSTQPDFVFAVADCTGHGVPGALMSMIGMQLLHEIVVKQQIVQPDQILAILHTEVQRVLKQKDTNTNDGMDIAVLYFQPSSEIVTYAGAKNTIYYIQNDLLHELKADKKPIGGQEIYQETTRTFTKHAITLRGNEGELLPTTFYLGTDGYPDQFGGEKSKKFMTKRLKELLLQIKDYPMYQQHDYLLATINTWITTGNESQTDDITVIGVRYLPTIG